MKKKIILGSKDRNNYKDKEYSKKEKNYKLFNYKKKRYSNYKRNDLF